MLDEPTNFIYLDEDNKDDVYLYMSKRKKIPEDKCLFVLS
jgi:hypothetical protein